MGDPDKSDFVSAFDGDPDGEVNAGRIIMEARNFLADRAQV